MGEPTIEAIKKHPYLTWVYMRREDDAPYAAAAQAKLGSGNDDRVPFAVCLATGGPGATFMLTGMCAASAERVSVLAVTGRHPADQQNVNDYQNMEYVGGHGMNVHARFTTRCSVC